MLMIKNKISYFLIYIKKINFIKYNFKSLRIQISNVVVKKAIKNNHAPTFPFSIKYNFNIFAIRYLEKF